VTGQWLNFEARYGMLRLSIYAGVLVWHGEGMKGPRLMR